MKRLLVKIRGLVQGVGFRYFAYKKAMLLGVKGYVVNLPDGSVLVDCEGDEKILSLFLDYLKKGPPYARVDGLEVVEKEPVYYESFEIKRY